MILCHLSYGPLIFMLTFSQKKTFRWFSYEASFTAVKGFVGELEIDIFSLKTMFALSFLIRYWH